MRRITRVAAAAVLAGTVVLGGVAQAGDGSPARYLKVSGSDTMPYRVVLRHCQNVEDTMANLRMVEYSPERVVYRCKRWGY